MTLLEMAGMREANAIRRILAPPLDRWGPGPQSAMGIGPHDGMASPCVIIALFRSNRLCYGSFKNKGRIASAIVTGQQEGQMLIHHLLSGLIIGILAATASLLQGYSAGAAVGFYIIGANVGVVVSVLGALSSRLPEAPRLNSILR
jgi:hypothetical protein